MTDITNKINRNNATKKIDNFYVSYLRLPDNISNLLGRQTLRISRPIIRFEESDVKKGRHQTNYLHQVRFDPVRISLADDEGSLTSQFIYVHLFKQLDLVETSGKWDHLLGEKKYHFDIKVQIMDMTGKPVDGYVLKNCTITEVEMTELNIQTDEPASIELTVRYDDIDFWVVDEYVAMKT